MCQGYERVDSKDFLGRIEGILNIRTEILPGNPYDQDQDYYVETVRNKPGQEATGAVLTFPIPTAEQDGPQNEVKSPRSPFNKHLSPQNRAYQKKDGQSRVRSQHSKKRKMAEDEKKRDDMVIGTRFKR